LCEYIHKFHKQRNFAFGAQECLMRFFWAKFANLLHHAAVAPMHQCKLPHEESRNCTLKTKMLPAAKEGGLPPDSLTRGSVPNPRYSHGPLQTQLLIILIMPCLISTIRGNAPEARYRPMFPLPCSPCLFLTPIFFTCGVHLILTNCRSAA